MTHRDKMLSLATLAVGFSLVGCADATATHDPQDGPEPVPGVTRTVYRVSDVLLPPTAHAAAEFGRDLDGDGGIDNRLGLVHGLLAERWDLSLSGGASDALRDVVPWLLVVDAVPGASGLDVWLAPSVTDDPLTPDLSRALSAHGRWNVGGAEAVVDGGREAGAAGGPRGGRALRRAHHGGPARGLRPGGP